MAEEPGPAERKIGEVLSVSDEEWERLTDQWAIAIGRFLVAFARCEHWTNYLIALLHSAPLQDAVVTLNISPRIDIALALIESSRFDPKLVVRATKAFADLRKLSGPRNLVAHNPPIISVSITPSGQHVGRHVLQSARDPSKNIEIPELERHTRAARDLGQEITEIYILMREELGARQARG